MATAQDALTRTDAATALVFDNHNCEYLLQKRNALNDLRSPKRLIGGLYSAVQWWKLRRYERWACTLATTTLAVSKPDAQALQELTGFQATIQVIVNGITLDDADSSNTRSAPPAETAYEPQQPVTSQPHRVHTQRLVFTGKMDYRPNIDAVLWFAEHVLPRIVRVRPNVRFQIVGMNPHPRILPLAESPHIEITGAVDDIQPYIQQAAVFVIPLRVGGGTRFKVLEAMAAEKAIVSTSLGVEGIPAVSGEHLYLADTPDAFAQAVLHLLTDQAEAEGNRTRTLGANAKRFVAAHYAWETIVPQLETIYRNLAQHRAEESIPACLESDAPGEQEREQEQ
jgi:polysaccharide biosynthesis protein PslH